MKKEHVNIYYLVNGHLTNANVLIPISIINNASDTLYATNNIHIVYDIATL